MKINRLFYNYNTICCLVFLIIGLILIIAIKNYPIGDFGNYYYGSKIYLEGNFTIENYYYCLLWDRSIYSSVVG